MAPQRQQQHQSPPVPVQHFPAPALSGDGIANWSAPSSRGSRAFTLRKELALQEITIIFVLEVRCHSKMTVRMSGWTWTYNTDFQPNLFKWWGFQDYTRFTKIPRYWFSKIYQNSKIIQDYPRSSKIQDIDFPRFIKIPRSSNIFQDLRRFQDIGFPRFTKIPRSSKIIQDLPIFSRIY